MDLRNRVLSALRWSATAKLIGQGFTWAMTIIVIRLLEPADYGLMAMALVFKDALMMFNEVGLGAALIQREHLEERTLRQTFGLILLANLFFALIMFFGSWGVAAFFNEPRVVPIMQVLAGLFLITGFEAVPLALLERELDFKRKSIIQLLAQVTGGATTLILALRGFGVWSLVGGSIAISLINTVGMNIVRPFLRWPSFEREGLKQLVSFGGLVASERLLHYIANRADVFIVGRILGKDLLGVYYVAMHLSSLIMRKTGEMLYTVSLPAFSRVQNDPEKIGRYLLKSARVMSFVVFPMFTGMAAVAPELVVVLLGEKWTSTTLILQILCLVMPLRMLANLFPPVLQGIGRPDASVKNLMLMVLIMSIAIITGAQWGLVGVSLAWLLAYPVVFAIIVWRSARIIHVTVKEFLMAMLMPALASAGMCAVVVGGRLIAPPELPAVVQLSVLILLGVATYVAVAWVINRSAMREVTELVRR